MKEPEFIKEGYAYINEDEQWAIKNDAPDWAKKEFEDFFKSVNPTPDENGVITQY